MASEPETDILALQRRIASLEGMVSKLLYVSSDLYLALQAIRNQPGDQGEVDTVLGLASETIDELYSEVEVAIEKNAGGQ